MKKILLTFVSVAVLGCKSDFDPTFELPKPENSTGAFSEGTLVNKDNPTNVTTTISQDGTYDFVANISLPAQNDNEVSFITSNIEKLVSNYNNFKGVKDYEALPSANYEFVKGTIKKGETSSQMQVKIKDYENLAQGDYLLPLSVNIENQELMHLVIVRKDAHYVPLSQTNSKPMPLANSCSNRTEPMKMVAYVETNDWDIRNMGQFLLKDSKKPVFDFVIMFAANMNYDAVKGRRVLYFNDKLQPIINDPDKYIKPLRDRGIKVLIDILPNHQGVGYYNFQNYEEALDFARQCKEYTDRLGIDGWDIDEEYARYEVLPQKPRKGNQSMLWFMRAMKEVMPDKLLTLYDYGHNLSEYDVDDTGKYVKDYVDYSWANYGEYHGSYAGIPDERYGRSSIEASRGGLYWADRYAQNNLDHCHGLLMVFNITGGDVQDGTATTYLSKATQLFYNEECIFEGKYHKGPKDN